MRCWPPGRTEWTSAVTRDTRAALAARRHFDASAHDLKQNRKETAMSDMTIEEIEQRIESLQNSGMHLAAKALMRELNHRRKAG
jgi:hypothetical protein